MEALENLMDSDSDEMTITLKRVHLDEDSLERLEGNAQSCEQDASMKAYHVSSMHHLHLDNTIDLDQINFEDDLEDILLDDTMMNEKMDWQEVCCTFLKNIMTPKKQQLLWKDHDRNVGSPIANLFRREEF